MDGLRKFLELLDTQSSRLRHNLKVKLPDKVCKRLKAGGMSVNVVAVNPTICDEPVCQAVQQDKIGFRPDGVMLGRGHRCLRLSRIDHDDFGPVLILAYALPHDRVCDTKIRTNKDKHIGYLEILVGIRRRIKPERLFVSCSGACHALACVAVAMQDPHAELCQGAQEREFLGADLAGAEPRNRFVAVFLVPFSGIATFTAIDMCSRHIKWAIVFPIVLPLLVAIYAMWARFPALRAAIPGEPMSAAIWALVLVLSGAALLTASII